LTLFAVANNFVNSVSRFTLGAIVNFLSLFGVKDIWAHPCKPAVAHDVETVALVVGISPWETMSLPISTAAEHELIILVFKDGEAIAVFWILDPELMPLMCCQSELTGVIRLFNLMSYLPGIVLDHYGPVSDTIEELFAMVVLLGL
jgi:hypothetical protein